MGASRDNFDYVSEQSSPGNGGQLVQARTSTDGKISENSFVHIATVVRREENSHNAFHFSH